MQEMGRPPPDDSSEDEEYDTTPLLMADVRRNTQVRGPKIQRYSADGLQLVKTYSGHVDAVRDAELPDMCRLRIKNATNTATLYKGFRWAALERAMPDDTVQDIGPTVVSATIQKGLVAMLDLDKKCVVQVFMDQKDAAEKRHFTGCAAISNAIKRGSKLSGPTTSCPKSAATARESISCIDRGCHHRDAHGAQVPDERDRVPGRRQGLQVAFLFVTKVK